jgi:hypothetical protein
MYPVEADRDYVGAPVGSRRARAVARGDPPPVECHRDVVLLAEATRRDKEGHHRGAQVETCERNDARTTHLNLALPSLQFGLFVHRISKPTLHMEYGACIE